MSNGRIPDEVIEAVLKHHDIVDVVSKSVHLTKAGHYMKGLCPFHSEKSPSFTVTPAKQIYYCYGCHAGGNAIHFIMEVEGCSFGEAVRQMAEEANIPLGWDAPTVERTQAQLETAALLDAYELSTKYYHHILLNTKEGKDALAYLRSRGLSDKLIETFRIGYAPPMWDILARFLESREQPLPLMEKGGLISARSEGAGYIDKFRDRVLFPISDVKGRIIAFGGRAMGDIQPKYMNSPESILFNKSRNLYNFYLSRAVIRKTRQVVLFEGYVDVIKAWEAGVLNGVATMGTSLTPEHTEILKKNAEQVIVCYDGDSAGQNAAFKSIGILDKLDLHVKIAMIPDGMDPDEYISSQGSEKFLKSIIESAVPTVKYKMQYMRRNFNLQDVDGKLRYLDVAVKLISELESPIDREHYTKELSSEFMYSFDAMKQKMNEYRQDFLKSRPNGDNKGKSWNNVMNNGRVNGKAPALLPAYHNAEIMLLAVMMHDRKIADYVEQQLGDHFNLEAHAALAAYLYAYFALNNKPDVSRYIATLQDESLERAASSILMQDANQGANAQVIDDYIREIKKYPQQQAIEQRKQQRIAAERSGNMILAAQIASEIITLEKQLK